MPKFSSIIRLRNRTVGVAQLVERWIVVPAIPILPSLLLCFTACLLWGFAANAAPQKPQNSPNPQDPAYWGLKPGEYIPAPGCFAWSLGRKRFGLEICTTITYLYVKD